MISAFAYFGGKANALKTMLPLLPESNIYVEPFMGSLGVFLNRQPKSKHNVLNDKCDHMVRFFRVVRDRPEEIARAISLTPWSRTEHRLAEDLNVEDEIEHARRVYTCLAQGRMCCLRPERNGFRATGQLRGTSIENRFQKIIEVADVLANVCLENTEAVNLVEKYRAKEDALIYCDPPYVLSTRTSSTYLEEMTDAEHTRFLESCNHPETKAKIAISGYASDLYDQHLSKWHRHEFDLVCTSGNKTGMGHGTRQEVLWLNYSPESANPTLF